MKRLLLPLLAVSLFLGSHQLVLASEEGKPMKGFVQVIDGCRVVKSGCLNIRLGPGTGFRKDGSIRIGSILRVDRKITNNAGEIWYRIKQDAPLRFPERIHGTWYVSGEFVRFIPGPVEPKSNPLKVIKVDLSEQVIRAYTGDKLEREVLVSTGVKGTETPTGEFTILWKTPSRYMQGPLPGMKDSYDLPGVPWVMYFTKSGAAFHGTNWHNNFGKKHSHGCVNLPVDESEWLYSWAAVGTKVVVVE